MPGAISLVVANSFKSHTTPCGWWQNPFKCLPSRTPPSAPRNYGIMESLGLFTVSGHCQPSVGGGAGHWPVVKLELESSRCWSADQVKVEAIVVNLTPPQLPTHCHPSCHRSSAWPPLPPTPPSPARPPNKARLGLPPRPGLLLWASQLWIFVNCHNFGFAQMRSLWGDCDLFRSSQLYHR